MYHSYYKTKEVHTTYTTEVRVYAIFIRHKMHFSIPLYNRAAVKKLEKGGGARNGRTCSCFVQHCSRYYRIQTEFEHGA